MVPHDKYKDLENTAKILQERYIPDQNRIITHDEKVVLNNQKAAKEHAEMMEKPAFVVPDRFIDDWTGSKYADNLYTYGIPKKLPEADPTFLPKVDPEAKEKDYTPEKTPKEENKIWEEKVFGKED